MSNIRNWLSEHRPVLWSLIGFLILLAVLPLAVYLIRQQQQPITQAWICRDIQTIDNGDGTYNVVVTNGGASWWRISSIPDNQIVAGPQQEQIFNQIPLAPGEYQVQASDNGDSWTDRNCNFTIETEITISCQNILLYSHDWENISVNEVYIGDELYIAVNGNTDDPSGITKARFSFDEGATWQETSTKNSQDEFYIEWSATDQETINVVAQVYNPNLGWK